MIVGAMNNMKLRYGVFEAAGFKFYPKTDRYIHTDSGIVILIKDNRYYNIHGTEYTTLEGLISYMIEETEESFK